MTFYPTNYNKNTAMKKYIFTKQSVIKASAEELFKWHAAKGAVERLARLGTP